jgi:phospholipid transport system substrate-binding protein
MTIMNRFRLALATLAVALAVSTSSPALAGDAQAFIQARHGELSAILRQPQSDARAKRISTLLDSMLDYDRLARDSLGKHWAGRSDDDRRKFTDVLKRLVKRNYEKNIQKTLDYQVSYLEGNETSEQALIRTAVKSAKAGPDQETISIDYLLHKREGKWVVYDIKTENSSMVNNYRNQFNKVMNNEGWAQLIKKLEDKLASPA